MVLLFIYLFVGLVVFCRLMIHSLFRIGCALVIFVSLFLVFLFVFCYYTIIFLNIF